MWATTDEFNDGKTEELVEYERGSVFGGFMSITVLVGFAYLLWNDIVYNIREKPYTFEVSDKLITAEECGKTEVNFGQFNKSLNFLFGLTPFLEDEDFDPLDNDYVDLKLIRRTLTDENEFGFLLSEDPDYEIEKCSQD